jgi:hypothetical protein
MDDGVRLVGKREKFVDMEDGRDPFEPQIPPAKDEFSMDDMSDIEMEDMSIRNAMTIMTSLENHENRIAMLEQSTHRRRCMPCGKRTVSLILFLLIAALVVNYFFDFSHALLNFAHSQGWFLN